MKKILSIIILSISLSTRTHNNILISSIPKTGTHLLSKCVKLILKSKTIHNQPDFIDVLNKVKNKSDKVLCTHMPYAKYRSKILTNNNYKGLFIYRDPRDTVVSLGYWWAKPKYSEYSDETLSDLISTTKITPIAMKENGITPSNINEYFKIFLAWKKDPNFYTVRFEDLVGEKGGGSIYKQKQALLEIANHIGVQLSNEDISQIQQILFGKTTFRSGQIGSWKKRFTSEHKKLFKKIAGQLLIDLGYEKNFNW